MQDLRPMRQQPPSSTVPADTIIAVATAPGAGGVGIVRLSGPAAIAIGGEICGQAMRARQAHHVRFRNPGGEVIDDGLVLSFPGPRSFTGEDVVELQAHGSPVVLQQLIACGCALGARLARPGEFSERAYLNGRLDLAQAEAIADLIAAADTRAARAARRSLEGVFSRRVDTLARQLSDLRVHVEAAIDFADEAIDTLGGEAVRAGLNLARAQLAVLLAEAERGRKLRDGLHAVIVGPPNAGKSSLLNALAGSDRAIVTDIAGTTRDTLHETIRLDGLELTLVDTAGLREGGDDIELGSSSPLADETSQWLPIELGFPYMIPDAKVIFPLGVLGQLPHGCIDGLEFQGGHNLPGDWFAAEQGTLDAAIGSD